MPTYKNIRIKMKNGKSRMQRVQVNAKGQYKFVKNVGSRTRRASSPRKTKKRRTRTLAKRKNYSTRAKAIIGKYGMAGMAEDLAWGYLGSQAIMTQGYPLESALPMSRIIQGLAGKALKRRGAGRLEHGILDLIDVYLIRQGIGIPVSLSAWK